MTSLSELKDRIKEAPISSIIGHYLSVIRRGSQNEAICPFHNDTHPSLKIHDAKGLFMCFSCQTGGDAITFVEKYKNLEFKEALLEIAQVLGIPTDIYENKRPANPKEIMGRKVLSIAAQIYQKAASLGPELEQFLKEREILPETAQKFMLGYAPGSNALYHYLLSIPKLDQALAMQVAKELGLIKWGPKGGAYDAFRERIIFPIWDQYGQVVGFGARATKDHQKGKYINSQESFLFNKKDVLYGLNFAKSSIREKNQVILVEGYMDMIGLYQKGFTQTVAVMGVGLGDHSLRTLKSMTPHLYLALDSDEAGLRAMERMNKAILGEGILAKYLDFRPHKDPDEFARIEGIAGLERKVTEAPVFIDVQIERKMGEHTSDDPDLKLAKLYEIFELLSPLKEGLAATERILSSAKKLGLRSDSTHVLEAYKNFLKNKLGPKATRMTGNEQKLGAEKKALIPKIPISKQQVPRPPREGLKKVEKILIQELVKHPTCLSSPELTEILDFVSHNEVKRIIHWLKNLYYEIDESEYSAVVNDYLVKQGFSLELREAIGAALFNFKPTPSPDERITKKLLFDLKKKVMESNLKSERDQLKRKQKEILDEQESLDTIGKIQDLEKKLVQVRQMKLAPQ